MHLKRAKGMWSLWVKHKAKLGGPWGLSCCIRQGSLENQMNKNTYVFYERGFVGFVYLTGWLIDQQWHILEIQRSLQMLIYEAICISSSNPVLKPLETPWWGPSTESMVKAQRRWSCCRCAQEERGHVHLLNSVFFFFQPIGWYHSPVQVGFLPMLSLTCYPSSFSIPVIRPHNQGTLQKYELSRTYSFRGLGSMTVMSGGKTADR